MPYIEGETLRDRIDREKQLPVNEAVRIALAVGAAGGSPLYGDGPQHGYAVLHEPGAGDRRPSRGTLDRHLRARVRAIRDAGG